MQLDLHNLIFAESNDIITTLILIYSFNNLKGEKIMNKNFMRMSLPSMEVNKELISSAIASFAEQLNPTNEEVDEITAAVDEAIDNCISFAYPNDDYGIISISCKILKNNVLNIVIKDYGIGIKDVEQAKEPLFTTEANNHSGMGFSIIEAFTTDYKISSVVGKGTKVNMKKRVGK